jgi:hypothetical protein
MKKIFKFLSVALVAVATFVSAGCSCSLSDSKTIEKVRALESTVVYMNGDEVQDFTMTYTEVELRSGTETKKVYDSNLKGGVASYVVTTFVGGSQTNQTNLPYSEDDEVNDLYNLYKSQPINGFGEMTNGKYRNLFGLETASDTFLNAENITIKAKKQLFGKEVTITIEYKVAITQKYRQTIKINGDNKLIYADVVRIAEWTSNPGGDTYMEESLIRKLEIAYK